MEGKLDINKYNLDNKQDLQAVADYIINNLKSGMSLQQATGLSDQSLEDIYSLAYGYYNLGKYKESVSLFQLLSSVSPNTYKYVLGLASSFHQLGVYQDAAAGFYIALHIESENPVPAYYLLDCLNQLKMKEEALEVADLALELCKAKPEFRELENRIALIKKSLVK